MQLTYIVHGARWHATYDVRIALDNSIQITYYGARRFRAGTSSELMCTGIVGQTTGEDWKDVLLLT